MANTHDYIVAVELQRNKRVIATACCTVTLEGPRQRTDIAVVSNIVTYGWNLDDFGEMFSDREQETVMPLPTDTIRVYSVYEEGRNG